MELKLNQRGLTAMLFRSFYNKAKLPSDLCSYFWLLVIAIVLTPIVYPAMILNWLFEPFKYNKEEKKYYDPWNRIATPWGIALQILLFLVGAMTTSIVWGKKAVEIVGLYKLYINGWVGLSIILGGVVGLFYLISYISKKTDEKKEKKLEMSDEEYALQYEKKTKAKLEKEEKFKKSFIYLCYQAFLAFKNKYCPIINWEENEKNN